MRRARDDRDLDLRELGGGSASPGFTRRVLDALDVRAAQRRRAARRRAAGLTALVLAAGLGALLWIAGPGDRTAARAPQSLLEPPAIEAGEATPVLYLGEMDGYDLVLDLGPLLEEPGPGQIRPAALTGEGRWE